MRKRLLEVLACPNCRRELSLPNDSRSDPDTWIEEGTLKCSACSREYLITCGVPNLLPHGSSAEDQRWSFDLQWRLRFEGKLEEGSWLWGWDLSQLSYRTKEVDSWYLDCGSGSGDHTRNVALQNQRNQVVGLDRSQSPYYAAPRDRDIENLHYVRGDILHPPLREAAFKAVVAVGVWHATGDTRKALLNSVELLQNGGFVAAWLYPSLDDLRCLANQPRFANRENGHKDPLKQNYQMWKRYYFFRDVLFLGLAHHFSPGVQFALCKLVSYAISPFGHVAGFSMPEFRNRLRSNTFVILDDISPTYQDRPTRQQVFGWFHEAGVPKVVHNFRRGGVFLAVKP